MITYKISKCDDADWYYAIANAISIDGTPVSVGFYSANDVSRIFSLLEINIKMLMHIERAEHEKWYGLTKWE